MNHEEYIDKYFSGELSPEEELTFRRLLKEDISFQKEMDFRQNISAVTKEEERIRLKTKLASLPINKYGPPSRNNKGIWIWIIVLGVLASALFGYLYFQKEETPEVIFAAHFEPYPNAYQPVTRNREGDLLTLAFQAYEQADFQMAIERFSNILDENSNSPISFYRGISYLAEGEYSRALSDLNQTSNLEDPYQSELNWYKGLAYLALGDQIQALQLFRDYLSSDKEILFREEASRLVSKLD